MWKLAANLAKEEEQKKQEQERAKEEAAKEQAEETSPVVRVGSKELSGSRKKLKDEALAKEATKTVDIKKKTGNQRKRDPTDIRLMTELSGLDLSAVPGVEINHPDKRNQKIFDVTVIPQDGLWKGAKFKFVVKTPNGYPHDPPAVSCDTRVYHPNIDLQGKVCLNILRAEWNPCLGIQHVLMGLMTLFLEPNADDPLNKEAADLMVNDRKKFEKNVYDSLRGGYVANHAFAKLL